MPSRMAEIYLYCTDTHREIDFVVGERVENLFATSNVPVGMLGTVVLFPGEATPLPYEYKGVLMHRQIPAVVWDNKVFSLGDWGLWSDIRSVKFPYVYSRTIKKG